jgi:hypothetical protein
LGKFGEQALKQHPQYFSGKLPMPAGDLRCADRFQFELFAQVLVGEATADILERGFLADLGSDHQLDELLGAHLFPMPVGFYHFESLFNLRKSGKELLEWGLIGILVHRDSLILEIMDKYYHISIIRVFPYISRFMPHYAQLSSDIAGVLCLTIGIQFYATLMI